MVSAVSGSRRSGSARPSDTAIAPGTCPMSVSAPPATHAASDSADRRRKSSCASRVLPIPAPPTIVSTQHRPRASLRAASSATRPTSG